MRNLLLSLSLASALGGFAQTDADLIELMRSDLRTTRQALVTANMNLSEEQSKVFWPLYDAYNVELKKVWDERIEIIKDYAAKVNTMDEATAMSLLNRALANDKEKVALRATWSKKMMKTLPASVVARFMQIDSQLDHLISAQLSDEIPLMPAK